MLLLVGRKERKWRRLTYRPRWNVVVIGVESELGISRYPVVNREFGPYPKPPLTFGIRDVDESLRAQSS